MEPFQFKRLSIMAWTARNKVDRQPGGFHTGPLRRCIRPGEDSRIPPPILNLFSSCMTPVEFREYICRHWSRVPIPAPLSGQIHAGGPGGVWLTLGLVGPEGPRSWVHFRMPLADMEVALSDPGDQNVPLRWSVVLPADVPGILRRFAQKRDNAAEPVFLNGDLS